MLGSASTLTGSRPGHGRRWRGLRGRSGCAPRRSPYAVGPALGWDAWPEQQRVFPSLALSRAVSTAQRPPRRPRAPAPPPGRPRHARARARRRPGAVVAKARRTGSKAVVLGRSRAERPGRFVVYLGHDAGWHGIRAGWSRTPTACTTRATTPALRRLRSVGADAGRPRRGCLHARRPPSRTGTAPTASAPGAAPRRAPAWAGGSGCARRTTASTTRAPTPPSSCRSSTRTTGSCWPAGRGFRAKGMSVLAGFVEPGREPGRRRRPRGRTRRSGVRVDRRHLPRRPALALPVLAHARLHRAGRGDATWSFRRRDRGRARWFTRDELAQALARRVAAYLAADLDRATAHRALVRRP